MERNKLQEQLLEKLAELGGRAFKDEDIVRQGDKLILPMNMSEAQAIDFLNRKIRENEETTEFSKTFNYRPWDGALCTYRAFKKAFGAVAHNTQTVTGFFGPQEIPPQLITIPTGPNTEEQIPWGAFSVPYLPGVEFNLGATNDRELGPLFSIFVRAPKKLRFEIEGLFILIENELKTGSMYKGKAIDGGAQPGFLDLTGVDPKKVTYSADVMAQLEANVWSLIRYTDNLRDNKVSLKRAVLVEGPYGTGKTLSAYLTAQEAVNAGWTFLYARPGKDDLRQVMQTARLYQPAVVFMEDMDTVASPEEGSDGVSQMLDLFDGIQAKGTEILCILTTNHPERIHKGMLRPGRLDAVIHIGPLDSEGVKRLIEVTVPEGMLAKDVDFKAVGDAMDGFVPAYVKEAIERAVRYGIVRTEGRPNEVTLDTEDFINAANGLRPQLELMEGAGELHERDKLGAVVSDLVTEAIESTVHENVLRD